MDRAQRQRLHEAMVRLADGDRSAFEPVYATLFPLLRRFTERAMAGSPDAEDAAQAALLEVFSRAAEFDSSRDAMSWVLGIAAYQCKTFRRKSQRRREGVDGDEPFVRIAAADASPEERLIACDLSAAARDVLGTLDDQDIETLEFVLAGNRPEGATFRKRVERAMKRFREAWRAKHGTE